MTSRKLFGSMVVAFVFAGVGIRGDVRGGQPVEPARNRFADDAWQLPPEGTRPMAQALQTQCQLCHSADYLTTQPPLTRIQWTAVVEKMRGKFGAVIPTNQVPVIAEALVGTQGEARPAAPAP